jgi:hypothetical protein
MIFKNLPEVIQKVKGRVGIHPGILSPGPICLGFELYYFYNLHII